VKIFQTIWNHPTIQKLARQPLRQKPTFATFSAGGSASAAAVIAAGIYKQVNRPVLYITAHLDEADETADELSAMGLTNITRFPALEVLPGETGVSPELVGERLTTVRQLLNAKTNKNPKAPPPLIIAPIPALMQSIPHPDRLDDLCLNLVTGQYNAGPGSLLAWLEAAGYHRVDSIESPGEHAVRGGLIDIYPAGGTSASEHTQKNKPTQIDEIIPVRLDFFGDQLESICEIDPDTMASDRKIDRVQIIGADTEALLSSGNHETGLWDVLPTDTVVILHELMEINEQGRGYFERATRGGGLVGTAAVLKAIQQFAWMQLDQNPIGATDPDATVHLPFNALPSFSQDAKEAITELSDLARNGPVVVFCNNEAEKQRFTELLYDQIENPVNIEPIVSTLCRGFIWNPPENDAHLAAVPYNELLHRYQTRRRFRRIRAGRAMDTFLDLQPGDYVVHRDHGIGRFVEFGTKSMGTKRGRGKTDSKETRDEQEYITIEFHGRSRLHVPAAKMDLIQRYVGGHGRPNLSKLGGKRWAGQKQKVSEAVRDLAAEMLKLQAVREHRPGITYPQDTNWQRQFEAAFPYEETEDQIASINEIKKDMNRDQPMDRLLCGDVGFGKTELAIRAAFKAAEFGKQVALLVPTTVLCEQHARTFRQRFADYPFQVEALSRFSTKKEIDAALERLSDGRSDIVIGTHRLLSKDIRFADLGLVIIDEEQRFGVEHKQRLLQFRMTADVLVLTATPIPRTLHMSMLGLRDISSLTTAPLDRRAVVTEVIPYNEQRIKQAIQRELAREGQIFFVHNRVHNIQTTADRIQRLVPDARIVIGHGQMPDRELERVMLKFIRGQADILVSTTIIESGIDIPNANTMFINDANRFGLADLHQLRGRVGRYKHRAYCYLLLGGDSQVSTVAAKRLKAIEEYSMLGAGFRIAMRDLEIRGAGNLLGAEQSGHIAVVGYEMYCRLLEEAAHDLKNERVFRPIDTEVEIGLIGSIPKGYIPSNMRRMEAYRRISQARTEEELQTIEHDLTNAYGQLPPTTQSLLDHTEIRILAAQLDIKSITRNDKDIIFKTTNPIAVVALFRTAKGTVQALEPKHPGNPHEVYYRPPKNYLKTETLTPILRKRLKPEIRTAPVRKPGATGRAESAESYQCLR